MDSVLLLLPVALYSGQPRCPTVANSKGMNRTTAHRGAGCSYWPSPPSHCLRVHTSGRLAKVAHLGRCKVLMLPW